MTIDTKLPDFDTLSRLYREDPAAFETFRRQMLRQAVDEAPQRHRPALEELLTCIEANRQCAATPADAALGAFQLMRHSVSQLTSAWQLGLQHLAQYQAEALLMKLRTG